MSVWSRWLTSIGLLVVAVVFGSIGCGGGGGGGGGPTEPPPPSSGVTFTAAGSAGANSIYLAPGTNTAANRFVLDVKTSQVDDLYGVSFNLEFPDARLRWVPGGSQEGSFLSSSGSTDFIVAEDSPGVLIVGLSLLGDVAGSSGSGTLLSLEFEPVSSGSGPMTMTRHDAINSTGDVKTLVEWIGGSVSVSI
ncbi:MAG: cohesin domain-containing protein [Thermoanaerobaculia bacterium]